MNVFIRHSKTNPKLSAEEMFKAPVFIESRLIKNIGSQEISFRTSTIMEAKTIVFVLTGIFSLISWFTFSATKNCLHYLNLFWVMSLWICIWLNKGKNSIQNLKKNQAVSFFSICVPTLRRFIKFATPKTHFIFLGLVYYAASCVTWAPKGHVGANWKNLAKT